VDSQYEIHEHSLMLKWIWKLNQNIEELWAELIDAKYLSGLDLFSKELPVHGSQFWNAIQKVVLQNGGQTQDVQRETHFFFG
jgi:hypothetical protein